MGSGRARVVAVLVGGLLALAGGARAPSACPPDADAFWRDWRRAVLSGDGGDALRAVALPLSLRGPLAADGVRLLDRAGFLAVWPDLLSADPGLPGRPGTMRELALSLPVLPAMACDGGQIRVGAWLFQRVGGQWRLTTAWLDQP